MTAYMDHKNLANEVIDDARAREITDGVHRVLAVSYTHLRAHET